MPVVALRSWAAGVIVAIAVVGSSTVSAEMSFFVDLALVGSELDGPKPSADWDLGLYRGISINPAVGVNYHVEALDFALQAEWFNHTSEPMGYSSELDINGMLLKAIFGVRVAEQWRLFLGVGRGNATIKMDNSTCLSYSGCIALPYQYPTVSDSSRISATLFGVGWMFTEDMEAYAGFQTIESGRLNFTDALGTVYVKNALDMPSSFIGIRWYF